MNIKVLRPHPLTVFYLMRSYWLVFVAPPIRILLQYLFIKEVQIFLLFETVVIITAFFLAFFRWYYTQIVVFNDIWVIKKGLFIKSRSVIHLSNASGIYVKRGFIDVLFKSANVYINTQTDDTEQNNLKIKFKLGDLEKIFSISDEKKICPVRTRRNFCRFFVVPLWIALTMLLCFLTIFKSFEVMHVLITLALNIYFAGVCYHNYKNGKLYIGKYVSVIGSKGLSLYSYYCKKESIGAIKIYQTPADRAFKTCKVKFFEFAEGAKGIKVRNVNLNDTVANINEAFNLNINV